MSITVFAQQQQTIENQLSELQQQIQELQQQKDKLRIAENTATNAFESLKSALTMFPDAKERLKEEMLALFKDDDTDSNNGGGSEVEESNYTDGDYLTTEEYPSYGENNGSGDFMRWVQIRADLGYFQREDEAVNTVYIAASNKARLKSWCRTVQELIPGCSFEMRRGHRLERKWEAKFWGLGSNDVKFLSDCDFYKNPSDYFADEAASDPKLDGQSCEISPQPTEPAAEGQPNWQIGDKCEVISERHGTGLMNKIGTITSASGIGCAVSVDGGEAHFFRTDEIGSLKKHLATAG